MEMVERVARAMGECAELIDDAQYSDGKLYLTPGDIQVAVIDLMTLARAAMEAMRVPTAAMGDTFMCREDDRNWQTDPEKPAEFFGDFDCFQCRWSDAIDAALKKA